MQNHVKGDRQEIVQFSLTDKYDCVLQQRNVKNNRINWNKWKKYGSKRTCITIFENYIKYCFAFFQDADYIQSLFCTRNSSTVSVSSWVRRHVEKGAHHTAWLRGGALQQSIGRIVANKRHQIQNGSPDSTSKSKYPIYMYYLCDINCCMDD